MTEEEFRNLKVDDIIYYRPEESVERVLAIDLDGGEIQTIIIKSRHRGIETVPPMSEYGRFDILPLYNSPLYKAMNEEEENI